MRFQVLIPFPNRVDWDSECSPRWDRVRPAVCFNLREAKLSVSWLQPGDDWIEVPRDVPGHFLKQLIYCRQVNPSSGSFAAVVRTCLWQTSAELVNPSSSHVSNSSGVANWALMCEPSRMSGHVIWSSPVSRPSQSPRVSGVHYFYIVRGLMGSQFLCHLCISSNGVINDFSSALCGWFLSLNGLVVRQPFYVFRGLSGSWMY